MVTKERIENISKIIDKLFYNRVKSENEPKYLLKHNIAEKNVIESLEERLKAWGLIKNEKGNWIANDLRENMKTKVLIMMLKRTKKFVLGNQGNISLFIQENYETKEIKI